MKTIIAFALAALSVPLPAAPANEARGRQLLAEARAACGGAAWDTIVGWHERGVISRAGRPDGPYEEWSAITALAMAMRIESNGAVVSFTGSDATSYWRVLPSGAIDAGSAPGPLRLHARDAFLSNFAYFLPGRFPATVTARDARTVGGAVYDVVSVAPAAAEGFDLWIDRASHHVARFVVGDQVAELRNYRTVAGVCAPTIAIQSDGDLAHTTTIHVDSVDTSPLPNSVFAPPSR